MIEVQGVTHAIGPAAILRDIDLALPRGALTALIGPNGAGKSTLLRLIGRLEPLQRGRICVDGQDITRTPSADLARRLAILGQNTGIASRLRVRELVSFGRWPHCRGRPTPRDRAAVAAALVSALSERPVPVEAVAFGVFGAVAALVGRCRGAPVWLACAWVAVEAVRSRVPFGGFPWGRIAFGQPDGFLLPLAALAGAPGLSFVVVLLGAALAAAAGAVVRRQPQTFAGPAATVAVIGLLVWTMTPAGGGDDAGERSVTVAVAKASTPEPVEM